MGGLVIRDAHFPGRAPVDAYGKGGFRFAEMSHRGSLLCLPSGIYGWAPQTPEDVTGEALSQIIAEATDLDVVLFGVGTLPLPLPDAATKALRAAGIRFDTMTTGAAVRTFNVMVSEERRVAAGLLAVD